MKTLVATVLLCWTASQAVAEEILENMQVDTSRPAVERGMDELMGNCHNCHSLKYVKYLDLVKLGIDRQKIDGLRGDQPLDAPLTSLMSDEAAMQSFGKVPPDLSLMAKARDGGTNYLYTYLAGYYNKPDGTTSNHVFPETKMPDPFGLSTTSDENSREEIRRKARDVVSFLYWASDPHEEERHRLGYYVIGYLIVLAVLLYFVKQQVWSRLE
jgi:ubiquinol-cytochrome c reductase cytochrome c1 subunit